MAGKKTGIVTVLLSALALVLGAVLVARHFNMPDRPTSDASTQATPPTAPTPAKPREGEPDAAKKKRENLAKLDSIYFYYQSKLQIDRVFAPVDPKNFEAVSREINFSRKSEISGGTSLGASETKDGSTKETQTKKELSLDQKFLYWLHVQGASSSSEEMSLEMYSSDDTKLKEFHELLPKLKSRFFVDLTPAQIDAASKALAKESVQAKEQQLKEIQGEAIVSGTFTVTVSPTDVMLSLPHPISKDTDKWAIVARLPIADLEPAALQHFKSYHTRQTNFFVWGKAAADTTNPAGKTIELIPYAVW